MVAVSDVLLTLHYFVLLGFIGVTSLLMLVTVLNRLRVRRVLLTWRGGRLLGLPLWPTIFLGAVSLLALAALFGLHDLEGHLLAGYFIGGLFWLASSMLSAMIVVTEYGLVLNVNHPDRAVAWPQVADYFAFCKGNRHGFVFLYNDRYGRRCRLELTVPPVYQRRMEALVSEKLDTRFEVEVQEPFGKKALEG